MEAIILAGGLGTRLQSYVPGIPKSLAPVNGKPFLHYLVRFLKQQSISRIILSLGYLSEQIEKAFEKECEFATEPQPMGTGGGIRLAMEKCRGEEILILNGDSFFNLDIARFMTLHKKYNADSSLALCKMEDAGRYGTIERNADLRIVSFKEKAGLSQSGFISTGVYCLNKKSFLQHTPPNTPFSIEKDYFETQAGHLKLYGFPFEGYFIDIGIPGDFERAQNDFSKFSD